MSDQFVPQAKPIKVVGGNDAFNARVIPGGSASPMPITPAARIGGSGQNSFVPVQGTREVTLAGSIAPATLQGAQAPQVIPTGQAAAPQGSRFQSVNQPLPTRQPVQPQAAPPPVAPPVAAEMGRAPYLQQPQGDAVYRVTLTGRTSDGQPWDSVHDAAFPAGVQLDGPPAIERVQ